jgi:hypothetical protein
LADRRETTQLIPALARLRQTVAAAAARLPTQDAYIADHCDYRTAEAA